MLEVGNGGLSDVEARAHFSLWAILAAPLMAGNDLRSMSPATRDILTNREVIAVNQDPLGRQGRRVSKRGDLEVWARELHDGSRAVVLFNRGAVDADVGVSWPEIGYPAHLAASVRDLWGHEDRGRFPRGWTARVPAHGAAMVLVRP
jgi:alpha-galactosidase